MLERGRRDRSRPSMFGRSDSTNSFGRPSVTHKERFASLSPVILRVTSREPQSDELPVAGIMITTDNLLRSLRAFPCIELKASPSDCSSSQE